MRRLGWVLTILGILLLALGATGAILLGPLILYGAHHAGVLQAGKDYYRLIWIGAVAIGVRAVARYALQQRNAQGYLLLFTGAVALLFGVRDWLVNRVPTDNNPVFLTSFAGLLFIPLVAWILIDRFVRTTTELERLNAELEARVASKSAELRRALERIGRVGSFNWLFSPAEQRAVEHVADEVAHASALLSADGHGALIVLERDTGLEEVA